MVDRIEKLGEVLTRLGDKISSASGDRAPASSAEQGRQPRLLPDRHPMRDFFIADIVDWALKDDRHSMEHPMFSLSKNPDRRIRRYEHNGVRVTRQACECSDTLRSIRHRIGLSDTQHRSIGHQALKIHHLNVGIFTLIHTP
jgi:replication initiator protein A